jgi:hypothetical protein
MEKEFKFTIKDKKTGKVLVETIVNFGSSEHPFPEDWKDNPMAQMSLYEYKQELLNKMFQVDISEDLEFTLPEKQS